MSESIVRGTVEASLDGRCGVVYERGGFKLPCNADVTILRHEGAKVGEFERGMLEAVEMCIRFTQDELDVSYLADLIGLRDALSHTLGTEE